MDYFIHKELCTKPSLNLALLSVCTFENFIKSRHTGFLCFWTTLIFYNYIWIIWGSRFSLFPDEWPLLTWNVSFWDPNFGDGSQSSPLLSSCLSLQRSPVAVPLKFRTPSWPGITAPARGVWRTMTVRRALRALEERSFLFAQRKAPGVKSRLHAQVQIPFCFCGPPVTWEQHQMGVEWSAASPGSRSPLPVTQKALGFRFISLILMI